MDPVRKRIIVSISRLLQEMIVDGQAKFHDRSFQACHVAMVHTVPYFNPASQIGSSRPSPVRKIIMEIAVR